MLHTLENDTIKITADTRGGELHSITGKQAGTEFLWNGDPAYWKYRAPILFPIVGKVIDGQYRVGGKTYELPQHGLARISEFTLAEKTADSISFRLASSAASLKAYPFHFALTIAYTLGENTVTTALRVENPGGEAMPYSIGAHPAFLCPIDPADDITDCYLEFSEAETASVLPLTPRGYLSRETRPYLSSAKTLALSGELFQHDAIIFERLASKTLAIKSKRSAKSLEISIADFPFLGIWAPADGAPFLCIEPWQGHSDFDGFTGEFKDKAGVVELSPGKSHVYRYQVKIAE